MNERLVELRKALNFTQKAFGEKLGLSESAISNMKSGRYNITDTLVKLMCQKFNVNEEWFRTGIGDMFVEVPSDTLDRLAHDYSLSDMAKRFVKTFIELNGAEMDAVLGFMEKVVSEGKEEFAL